MIDATALFTQLFSSFWWVIPLFVLAALFKSAWFKGVTGEAMVNLAARLFLNQNDYRLTKNTAPTDYSSLASVHMSNSQARRLQPSTFKRSC